MKASVSAEADEELTEGALHYAREGGAQIGAAFIAEFEKVVELLCAYPEIGAPWHRSRRRIPVRKFPYSIIYYVRDDEIRIVALAHHRRKPGYGASRK